MLYVANNLLRHVLSGPFIYMYTARGRYNSQFLDPSFTQARKLLNRLTCFNARGKKVRPEQNEAKET